MVPKGENIREQVCCEGDSSSAACQRITQGIPRAKARASFDQDDFHGKANSLVSTPAQSNCS